MTAHRTITADLHQQNVTALCRAMRPLLQSPLVGIRSKASQSPTFNFVHAEIDFADDLPAGIEAADFSASGLIIADVAAIGPRTLAILAVED
jgi:hypothetical protein